MHTPSFTDDQGCGYVFSIDCFTANALPMDADGLLRNGSGDGAIHFGGALAL
jgi:hypothetical protein